MRLTNAFGAIITLFLMIGIDFVLIGPVYDFINSGFSGDARTVMLLAMAVVFLFVTLGLPLMVAVEDNTVIQSG